jgi:hypothetical protein
VKQELDKTGLDKKSLLLHFLGIGTTAVCAWSLRVKGWFSSVDCPTIKTP